MQTESAIKSKTIPAHEIPEQFETLLGEIKNGMEIKISRDGVVIARMVPEPVAAKKASLPDFYGRAKAKRRHDTTGHGRLFSPHRGPACRRIGIIPTL